MKVQCFPGIKTEQIYRVMEKRDVRILDTVIIHVGKGESVRVGLYGKEETSELQNCHEWSVET